MAVCLLRRQAVPYSRSVSRFIRQLSCLMRASLLVLLALGLLTKPVLSAVSEIHTLAHPELITADDHGHSHDVQTDDDERKADHTQGSHGLMHQAGPGGAFDHSTARLDVPMAAPYAALLPAANPRPRSSARLTSPFRPPIA